VLAFARDLINRARARTVFSRKCAHCSPVGLGEYAHCEISSQISAKLWIWTKNRSIGSPPFLQRELSFHSLLPFRILMKDDEADLRHRPRPSRWGCTIIVQLYFMLITVQY